MDCQTKNHRRRNRYALPLVHLTDNDTTATDDALLQKKANQHILEHIDTRIAHVRAFLELFRPGIEYEIVPIDDVYGPTGTDPDIQALVVSHETIAGAESSKSRLSPHT